MHFVNIQPIAYWNNNLNGRFCFIIAYKINGIYITPHISGQYHLAATLDNIVHIAANNIEAFLKGDPLKNVVDFTTGYKK